MVAAALITTRARPVSVALAAVVYTATLVAFGAEPAAPAAAARLEVDAPLECATKADLIARVRARSPRVTFVDDETALAIRAQFSVQPSGSITGDLTLSHPGTKPTSRRVVARSCGEAADALALMIAVTLDPTSAEQGGGAAGTAATGATEATGGAASSAPPGAAPSPSPGATNEAPKPLPPPATTTSEPTSSKEPDAPPEPSLPSAPRFGVSLAAQSFVGPAPGIMPGVALYVLAGIDRPALWSPTMLVGFSHSWRTGVEEEGGTASFMLDAASFDACPWRVRLPRTELRPCASVLVGRLAARGSETRNPADESVRPFWVVGGAALVTVDIVWHLEASARVGVGGNLVQDSFTFGSNVFHTVGAVTVAGSVGLGVRLP
jgi:hypothetical protein